MAATKEGKSPDLPLYFSALLSAKTPGATVHALFVPGLALSYLWYATNRVHWHTQTAVLMLFGAVSRKWAYKGYAGTKVWQILGIPVPHSDKNMWYTVCTRRKIAPTLYRIAPSV